MDSIYSAANSASRAVFGDTNTNTNTDDVQNRPQNRTDTTTDTSRTADTNNPFRGTTTGSEGNPGRVFGGPGFGTQHTAGSGPVELNKPATIHSTSFGDADKYPTRASTIGTYPSADKPTMTTTSTFDKPSVGDLNRDGTRHESSEFATRPFSANIGSEERPTISDVTGAQGALPGAYPSPASASAYKPLASEGAATRDVKLSPTERHQLDRSSVGHTDTAATDPARSGAATTTTVSPQGSGIQPGEHHTARSDQACEHDRTPEHENTSTLGSGIQPGEHRTSSSDLPRDRRETHKPTSAVPHQGSTSSTGASTLTPSEHRSTDATTDKPSEGTGELYEKSTGVAAEGGNFDASRPGAGREAEYV